MKKAFSLTIHGKVQGVFYRENAVKKAQELCICGFVKNVEDSTVLCIIEGDELILKEFVAWCYEGSKSAKVEKIDINEIENQDFSNFSISY